MCRLKLMYRSALPRRSASAPSGQITSRSVSYILSDPRGQAMEDSNTKSEHQETKPVKILDLGTAPE